MELSSTNKRILEKRKAAEVGASLPMPDMRTGNSSQAVYENNDSPLVNVLFKGVLGGATSEDYKQVGKAIGQGTARAYQATGQLLVDAATDPKNVSLTEEIDPNTFFGTSERAGKVGRAIFGDKPFSFKKEDEELLSVIGLEGGSDVSGGSLTVLLTTLDLFTGGSASGLKGLITSLRNVDNVVDAGKVMRTAGFTEDIVEEYAPIMAATKDIKDTTEALKAATKLQNTTNQIPTTPLRTTDGSEPITIGGKVFSESVDDVRSRINTRATEVGVQVSKGTEVPNMMQLRAVTEALKEAGAKVDDITKDLDDLDSTLKTEPERFIKSPEVPTSGKSQTGPLNKDTQSVKSDPLTKGASTPEIVEPPKKAGDIQGPNDKRSLLDRAHDEVMQDKGYDPFNVPKSQIKEYIMRSPTSEEVAIKEAVIKARESKVAPAKKLDEVANPIKENLGMLSVHVQERYGKKAVTKSKADKFRRAEEQVTAQLGAFVKEVIYQAEKGGEMIQQMPEWIPPHLQSMPVIERVLDMVKTGDFPTVHGTPEMDLYIALIDETAHRAGIKFGPTRVPNADQAILQSFRRDESSILPIEPERVTKVPKKEQEFTFEDPNSYEDAVRELNQEGWPTQTKTPDVEKQTAAQKTLDEIENTVIEGEAFKPQDIFTTAQGKHTDVWRLNKKVWGKHWDKFKEVVLDQFDAAKGAMIAERKVLRNDLYEKVVKGSKIKPGSKASAAVMKYGEGKLPYADLVKQFPKEADEIVKTAEWMRKEYNRMIIELNAVEKRIGVPLTKSREDYFRHMQEETSFLTGVRNMFESTAAKGGDKDDWFTKEKWMSMKQERTGDITVYDAVGGYLDYIEQFLYAKHINPEAARIGDLTKEMQVRYGDTLPNYLNNMNSFVRDLNGMANGYDRFFEHYGWSRESLNFLDSMNKRAKRNAVLGNFSSAMSQILAVPFVVGSAKQHVFKGILRTLGDFAPESLRTKTGMKSAWEKSTYIAERYKDKGSMRFNTGMLENAQDMAGWMISILDEVSVKLSFNSHYQQALARGIKDPVKYADYHARRISGGRGVGEVPLVHKSKLNQIVIPFQYEVANQWFLVKDMMSEEDFAGLVAYSFAAYAVYSGVEEVTGAEVGINPIEMLYDSYKISSDVTFDAEGEADTLGDKRKKVGARVAGEVLTNMPLGGYVAAGAVKALGMTEEERRNFFGDEDPLRFSNAPLLWNSIYNEDNPYISLYRMLPAWGGRQIEKTTGGIGALSTGVVTDHSGKPMYDVPVEPGAKGVLRNLFFGKFAPNFEYKDDLENEMRALYHENKDLMTKGNREEAKKNLSVLNDKTAPVYKKVALEEIKKKKAEQIERGKKLVYTLNALKSDGKVEEAKKILSGLTKEEFGILTEAKTIINGENYDFKKEVEKDPESWIRETIDYAYAFGTNFEQAWDLLIQGEHIETTVGGGFDGMVTARRISEEESQAIKKNLLEKAGIKATDKNMKAYKLEHKLPLTLGGNNQPSNLEIVTNDVHDSSTAMEAYLGMAVKYQAIDYKDAQELILRFKGYKGEPITKAEIEKIVGRTFPSYKASDEEKEKAGLHRGLDDLGRNTMWLSDQDYSERMGENGRVQGKRGLKDLINKN